MTPKGQDHNPKILQSLNHHNCAR